MTRGERRALLAIAILLAIVCSAFFARAVLAHRAADFARGQARAALLSAPKSASPDFADRIMLRWTGASDQLRYWQALQSFRVTGGEATKAAKQTLLPLSLVFKLENTEAALRKDALAEPSPVRRSRLETMLGLLYVYDATLHRGEFPDQPVLEGKAVAAFRDAVLLDGSNDAAKTNLELLLRKKRIREQRKQHQKPLPDQARSEATVVENAKGRPSQNGSVGRHYTGGY